MNVIVTISIFWANTDNAFFPPDSSEEFNAFLIYGKILDVTGIIFLGASIFLEKRISKYLGMLF